MLKLYYLTKDIRFGIYEQRKTTFEQFKELKKPEVTLKTRVFFILAALLLIGTAASVNGEDGRWSEMNGGLGNMQVSAIDWEPDRTYAGTPTGLYIFWNRGVEWIEGSMGLPVTSLTLNIDGGLIFIARAGGSRSDGIWVSADNGQNWDVSDWMMWPSCVTSDIDNPNNIIAAASDGLHFSEDGGNRWFGINSAPEGAVDDILWGDGGSLVIISTDQGLYYSHPEEDFGQWESFGIELEGYHHQIALDADVEDRIWVAFQTRGDECGAYYIDGLDGEWQRAFHIPDCVVIASIPGLLAAGNYEGVYVSTNGGNNWTLLDEDWEDNRQVTDMHIRQVGDNYGILVSTFGDGVLTYTLDPAELNYPPEPFSLLVPENESWVRAEYDTTLIWQASHDPDPDDEVNYLLHMLSLGDGTAYTFETADTTYIARMSDLFNCGGDVWDQIEWWVEVIAGEDTVECEEHFTFEARGVDYVDESGSVFLTEFRIESAYPNPFNSSTFIGFSMPRKDRVRLSIFDASGCEIAVLCDKTLDKGCYDFGWSADGQPAGLYFVKLQCGDASRSAKLVLVR